MFPIEIIEQIVQNLADETTSLIACTLTSRALLVPARALLFRTIRLCRLIAPTRFRNLLVVSPYLLSLVTCLEISVSAAWSDDFEPLILSFCGPPDTDGRYHGAGPLRTVILSRSSWQDFPLRHVVLPLFSCSSVTTIAIDTVHDFFLSPYLPYFSPNLTRLNFYNSTVGSNRFPSEDDEPSPRSIHKPIHPARITSIDFKGSISSFFIRQSPYLLDFPDVNTIRFFFEFRPLQWSYFIATLNQSTISSSHLHTLAIIISPFTQSYHVSGTVIKHHVDLSISPFEKLHTLKIYMLMGESSVTYPLFWWLAYTLEKMSKRECHLKTLLVYLRIRKGSQVLSLGSEKDWAHLVKALYNASLTTVSFVVKLDFSDGRAIYDEFERCVRSSLVPNLPGKRITVDRDNIIWPPNDVYPGPTSIWFPA